MIDDINKIQNKGTSMQETILALLLTFTPADEAAKNEPGAKPMHGGGIIITKNKDAQPMHGGGIIITNKDK